MANFGIKPTRTPAGTLVVGQPLAITSASATSYSTFNSSSNVVAIQFRGGDVYATFDGATVPSASSAFQLYNNKAFHWDIATARAAKFIGVSGSVTAFLQEYQIFPDDTQLPDTSVVKSLSAP